MKQKFKFFVTTASVVSVCWLLVPSLGAAERPTPLPDVEALVGLFDTVVFGSEFGGVKASGKVKKWRGPLRIEIKEFGETVTTSPDGRENRRLKQQRVKRLHFEYVQKHLQSLINLTGLQTEDVKVSKKPANFAIYFVPPLQMANPYLANVSRGLMKRMAAQGGCYFLSWANDKSDEIQKATIVVNAARKMPKIDHCILEEMTQSLGMPNDADIEWPSIFSNTERIRALSAADRIIIKTLYDRRLAQGLPRQQALEMARTIITELHGKPSD